MMSLPRMSRSRKVLDRDIPFEDIMSQSRTSPLRTSLYGHKISAEDVLVEDVLDGDVPIEDIMSAQGPDILGRMSLCGHQVIDKDVLGGDVLGKDIKSLCGHHVLNGDALGRDVMSTQGRPRADVPGPVEDIYVCFYFCPFVCYFGADCEANPIVLLSWLFGKPLN